MHDDAIAFGHVTKRIEIAYGNIGRTADCLEVRVPTVHGNDAIEFGSLPTLRKIFCVEIASRHERNRLAVHDKLPTR